MKDFAAFQLKRQNVAHKILLTFSFYHSHTAAALIRQHTLLHAVCTPLGHTILTLACAFIRDRDVCHPVMELPNVCALAFTNKYVYVYCSEDVVQNNQYVCWLGYCKMRPDVLRHPGYFWHTVFHYVVLQCGQRGRWACRLFVSQLSCQF